MDASGRTLPLGSFPVDDSEMARYEIVKDVVDELIDLTLNERQSGHPGGSRSKVHFVLGTLLCGAMRWDVLRPWRTFSDRFVLSAGHTVPLIYAILATLNEGMRARHALDGDERFAFPDDGRWALTWEDLLTFRHRGGLPGHAEMAGKTLLLQGQHGPVRPRHARRRRRGAGTQDGRLPRRSRSSSWKGRAASPRASRTRRSTPPGAWASATSSSWSTGTTSASTRAPASSVIYGTPEDWFASHGWRTLGTPEGMAWEPVLRTALEAARGDNPASVPTHGLVPHAEGSRLRQAGRRLARHPACPQQPGLLGRSRGLPGPLRRRPTRVSAQTAPEDPAARQAQAAANLQLALSVLDPRRGHGALAVRPPRGSGRLPCRTPSPAAPRVADTAAIFNDPVITDFRSYPAELYKAPGEMQPEPRRAGHLGLLGQRLRAASATAARSSSPAPRTSPNPPTWPASPRTSASCPAGAGTSATPTRAGRSCPRRSRRWPTPASWPAWPRSASPPDAREAFDGFWGACSTYASFSYLKYGPLRLFCQMAQDTRAQAGQGPLDRRPLRPGDRGGLADALRHLRDGRHAALPGGRGHRPASLGAQRGARWSWALRCATDVPIVALHLTRPPVAIPDREALGIPSHFEAARGAYVMRPFRDGRPRMGTVFVRGTVPTANVVAILPELDRAGLNVKIVAAISPQLFRRQDAAYREATVSAADRWDAMAVTNGARRLMSDWIAGPGGRGVHPVRRPRRPLAHRRQRRRGHGRGAASVASRSWPASSASSASVPTAWRASARW